MRKSLLPEEGDRVKVWIQLVDFIRLKGPLDKSRIISIFPSSQIQTRVPTFLFLSFISFYDFPSFGKLKQYFMLHVTGRDHRVRTHHTDQLPNSLIQFYLNSGALRYKPKIRLNKPRIYFQFIRPKSSDLTVFPSNIKNKIK